MAMLFQKGIRCWLKRETDEAGLPLRYEFAYHILLTPPFPEFSWHVSDTSTD